MSMEPENSSVLVAGDVTLDWNIARPDVGDRRLGSWQAEQPVHVSHQAGGAALLANLLGAVLASSDNAPCRVVEPPFPQGDILPGDPSMHHSYTLWGQFPALEVGNAPVWRVREHLGLARAIRSTHARATGGAGAPSLVVIDDSGLGYRDDPDGWPADVTGESAGAPPVLLKMGSPVARGRLWEHLYSRHSDHLIAVVNVNALRESDVQVSRGMSWERTAQDLVWELTHNPCVNALSGLRATVVSFDAAGALLLERQAGEAAAIRLVFDPEVLEGEWEAAVPGAMLGYMSVLTTSLAFQILSEPGVPDLTFAVQRGLAAMRELHLRGFEFGSIGPETRLAVPRDAIARAIVERNRPFAESDVPDPAQPPGSARRANAYWTILQDTHSGLLEEVAADIVRRGVATALRDVPVGRFNHLLTVDRREIESFRSIRNLIAEYARQQQTRPLSIAVFGAPGAGKSFGVTQVAESILPGQTVALTFNLSQLAGPNDLVSALHQVRDIGLSGKLPLVFWDEFDGSIGDHPYGWLRYFLAPMQDGSFLEGQINHPIGKAIFVFAGGTSARMERFGENVDEAMFRAAKGPDFVSRLKGYVNVMGPDLQDGWDAGAGDPHAVIRRAILVRSIIERNAPQIVHDGYADIDPGVLRGFLLTGGYKHGVRSMESIVAMSTLTGRTRYERSSLPPDAQLDLHVNCRDFMARVQQLDLDGELLERLAREAHAVYSELGLDTPFAGLGFDELPESIAEQNRALVRSIPNRLAEAGYVMLPARSHDPPFSFPGDELERLAEAEHDRYMKGRIAEGWRYGPERDDRRRTLPGLVFWEPLDEDEAFIRFTADERARIGAGPLSEAEKDKDRALIQAIPRILARVGYTVQSRDPGSRA